MQMTHREIAMKMVADKATINEHLSKGGKLSDLKNIQVASRLSNPKKSG